MSVGSPEHSRPAGCCCGPCGHFVTAEYQFSLPVRTGRPCTTQAWPLPARQRSNSPGPAVGCTGASGGARPKDWSSVHSSPKAVPMSAGSSARGAARRARVQRASNELGGRASCMCVSSVIRVCNQFALAQIPRMMDKASRRCIVPICIGMLGHRLTAGHEKTGHVAGSSSGGILRRTPKTAQAVRPARGHAPCDGACHKRQPAPGPPGPATPAQERHPNCHRRSCRS